MNTPMWCPLPITDQRRPYVPSHMQTPDRLAETFRQFAPIHVSSIRDDYENTQADDWLEIGGFK